MPQWAVALLGVGVGAVIGFVGQGAFEWLLEGRRERAAAKLIYAELQTNLGSAVTHRRFGISAGGPDPTWTLYNAQAHAIARSSSLEQLGEIHAAYMAVDTLLWSIQDGTVGEGNLDALEDMVNRGIRRAGILAGLSHDEVDERIASAMALAREENG
jgi:hypothetical protein